MERQNYTMLHEFILVGFSTVLQLQYFFFVIFFCIFKISLLAHMCMILLYRLNPNLRTPMYFFLANFSILEICYLLTIGPKMLINLLSQHKTISFYGCGIQMCCFLLLGSAECYMLAAMAYDSYNAICHPLLYNNIMRKIVCIRLVIGCWLIGAMIGVLQTKLIFSLPFCRSNRINNFYCDIPPLMSLACNNTQVNQIIMLIITFIIIVGPFILTIMSYANIIWTILKHHPAGMRKKAFSTCTSHLIVVSMFYGSSTIMYLRPKSSYGMNEEKFLSLIYTIIAPMVNPFIYSLRNNDVKSAIKKMILYVKLNRIIRRE
ncbi:olfactory receptor 10AG1-like [Bufo gargarizans]|uniref:olfactory receptor 10AG1-like n=1 Tax=Bufo gargarizans TaxID=30331 RepID=UPI001CF284C0|nr:olfactory receptor 10AG1-like [Bufo gargarizans]